MQISRVVLLLLGLACFVWTGCAESGHCSDSEFRFDPGIDTCGQFGSSEDCNACSAPTEREACRAVELTTLDFAECNVATLCASIDEAPCLSAVSCRAVYRDGGGYAGCRNTAPSGAVRGGACEGLDAYECSRHDDCVAVHGPAAGFDGRAEFLRCADEPAAVSRAGE